jgi:uncharacterized protein
VIFNVAQLLKSAAGTVREYVLNEDITGIDESVEVVKPLTGKVKLLRTGTGILVTGTLQTGALVPCRRCLGPATVALELNLEEEFRPLVDLTTGMTVEADPDEDGATRTDARHMLDLTEVVRQDLLLVLPLSPVCQVDCKGLCPECGANLNEGPCGCVHQEDDPRLAILSELL